MILTKDGKVLTKDGKVLKSASSGGFGEAKLVATGTWNTQYKYFDLNTVLESNKIYMGKIIGGSLTMFFIAIYPNNYYFSTPTTIIDNNDSIFNVSLINYEKMTSNTSILQPVNSISDNIQTNDSYLEVEIYELPITLGGNE